MRSLKLALICSAGALMLAPLAATAAPLTIVNLSAHDIDCTFNPACAIAPINTTGTITIPGIIGTATLHTSSYLGVAGSPGAGLTAYAYRIDLVQAKAPPGTVASCVRQLILDFGSDKKIVYGPLVATHAAIPADVFVITTGGPGTIGLSSAVQAGSMITFTFSTPVCPGVATAAAVIPGKSSFVFGLTAPKVPKPSTAQVVLTIGGTTTSATRVPLH